MSGRKDLLGADYWLDVDKLPTARQRQLQPAASQLRSGLLLSTTRSARRVGEGDKFSYDYYANLRQAKCLGAVCTPRSRFHMSPRRRGRLHGHGGATAGCARDSSRTTPLGKSKTPTTPDLQAQGRVLRTVSRCACHRRILAYMVNPTAFSATLSFRPYSAIRLRRASIPRSNSLDLYVQPHPAVDHGGAFRGYYTLVADPVRRIIS